MPLPRTSHAAAFTDRPSIMFEYAIAQHQNHPPSKRLLVSWVISCFGHAALVLILLEYPQLLRGGMNRWFRSPGGITSSVPPKKEYRSVMVLGANMEMPPAEELKKYLYDWDQAKKKGSPARPIIVQLPRALLDDVPEPLPKPRQDPPAPAKSQPVVPAGTAGAAAPPSSASAGDARSATTAGQPPPPVTEPKQIPKGILATPPPGSAATGSATSNTASKAPTRPSSAGSAETKAAGQQTGVRLQGDVLFDTKGFNLDEYARMVKDRCEEHWLIPSNLRTFQGSVTIVFYITKEGQVTGAKIEVTSGNDSLNLSALSAVWESGPFPPLPRGFPAERVGARLVFAYNER
jgi:TonB family protein